MLTVTKINNEYLVFIIQRVRFFEINWKYIKTMIEDLLMTIRVQKQSIF